MEDIEVLKATNHKIATNVQTFVSNLLNEADLKWVKPVFFFFISFPEYPRNSMFSYQNLVCFLSMQRAANAAKSSSMPNVMRSKLCRSNLICIFWYWNWTIDKMRAFWHIVYLKRNSISSRSVQSKHIRQCFTVICKAWNDSMCKWIRSINWLVSLIHRKWPRSMIIVLFDLVSGVFLWKKVWEHVLCWNSEPI